MGCSHVILKDHVTGWAHVVLQWSHDFLGSCDLGVGAVMSQGSHDMGVCVHVMSQRSHGWGSWLVGFGQRLDLVLEDISNLKDSVIT